MELFRLYDNCGMEEKTNLVDAMQIDLNKQSVFAFVGAGGKTSTIFQLAHELANLNKKVIVTTTTHMYRPKSYWALEEDKDQILKMLKEYHIAVVGNLVEQGKISGVSEDTFIWMLDCADYILVEADGSKHLPLKAPNDYEPVLPPVVDEIVVLSGLSSLYKPIKLVCHRYELAMKILNTNNNHKIGPKDIVVLMKTYIQDNDLNYQMILNQSYQEKYTKEAMEIQAYLKEYRCILRTYYE